MSVAASKQVCSKPVAAKAWLIDEVLGHWDQLILRSWILEEDQKRLYQEGPLASIRPIDNLLSAFEQEGMVFDHGVAMSCALSQEHSITRPLGTVVCKAPARYGLEQAAAVVLRFD